MILVGFGRTNSKRAFVLAATLLACGPTSLRAEPERDCTEFWGKAASMDFASRWGGPPAPQPADPFLEIQDVLLRLLDGSDPDMRLEAVKALRTHVADQRVDRRFRQILDDQDESPKVRAEVIWIIAGANDPTLRNRVVQVAVNRSEVSHARAMALKALHRTSCREEPVRLALHNVLNSDDSSVARAAAAWALYSDVRNFGTRRLLLDTAQNRDTPAEIRVEAVRSLFLAMDQWDTQQTMLKLAEDPSLATPVREAAIVCLRRVNSDWVVRRALARIARADPSVELRRAAIRALGENQVKLTYPLFLLLEADSGVHRAGLPW